VLWGDDLSPADRDDLRWLTVREGGFGGMATSAAAALSRWSDERTDINAQLELLERGLPAGGDLSRKFRCGLGMGLMLGGAGTLTAAASSGAQAAVAVGAAIGAGVAVGVTRGIAAIALIVAGIFLIRKQKC
jgi:hypothetical protein